MGRPATHLCVRNTSGECNNNLPILGIIAPALTRVSPACTVSHDPTGRVPRPDPGRRDAEAGHGLAGRPAPLEPGVGLGAKHVLVAGHGPEQARPIETSIASGVRIGRRTATEAGGDTPAIGPSRDVTPNSLRDPVLEPPCRSAATPPSSAIARGDVSGTGATVRPDAPGSRGERRFAERHRPFRRPRPARQPREAPPRPHPRRTRASAVRPDPPYGAATRGRG